MIQDVPPAILREYDIRGKVGPDFGAPEAHALGCAFAAMLRAGGGHRVVVGRDGRVSSPMLEEALVEGLRQGGVDVVRIGLSTSPMLYFAEASAEDVQGGIEVTGSHNPADHNGFKMVLAGQSLHGAAIRELGALSARPQESHLVVGDGIGALEERDVVDAYVGRLLEALAGLDSEALGALRIGWDAGNGAAGPVIERLVARMPGEHHLLFTSIDGRFPNHHPDPTLEENLADLRALVLAKNLDFGVAFDGDADRIGVIDAKGAMIRGDQLLTMLAEDFLQRQPGARIVADVKASRVFLDRVAELGGQPELWKTGHSLIKSRMKETGILLGGEATGHLCFADDYYGFDDAFYAALRLIAASLQLGRSVTQLHEALPTTVITPELRIPVDESRKFAVVEAVRLRQAALRDRGCAIDGLRVASEHGWWLLRASNTEAALTARAESDSEEGLARLLGELDAELALEGIVRSSQGAGFENGK